MPSIPAALLAISLAAPCSAQQFATYRGPCDASAAVALGPEYFVVGDDERNTLHIYRRGQADAVGSLNLAKFLATRANEEADIEGAAMVSTRIYWITSHGRSGSGKAKPGRQRFFATEVLPGQPPALAPVDVPYINLLRDMAESDALKPYRLQDAATIPAEANGGLNIEGLAATPEGGLLIGLRNPLRQQRALIILLRNPGEVIQGGRARFGVPIELDLAGRGIRSIELVGSTYLIVAGPVADSGTFALYRWSGRAEEPATLLTGVNLGNLRPEALFAIPQTDSVQLLSDDGGVKTDGVECKSLPAASQTFRSLIIKP